MLSKFYTQTHIGMMLLFVSMLIFTPILSEAHETEFPSKKLDGIFPEAKKFVQRNVVLTNDKITSIEKELGSKLRKEDLKPIFYIAISKEKKPLGLVLFVDVQGPSGIMDGGVGLNMKGKVVKVEVYEHKESETIASEKFLKQFVGKGIDDKFEVGKDITAVKEQEKASKAVTLMPKKTLVMSYALFLKRKPKPDNDDTKPEPEETPEGLPEVEDLKELMTLMVDDYYVIVDYFEEDEGKEDAVTAAKRLALYAELIPDFEPPKNADKTEEYVDVQEKFTKTLTEFATALDKNGITDATRKKWDEIVTFVNQVHTRFTEEGIDLDAY